MKRQHDEQGGQKTTADLIAEQGTDYTAKPRIAFNPRHAKGQTPLVTGIKTCPDCGRPTYITHTTDTRPPYDRAGCFYAGCRGKAKP